MPSRKLRTALLSHQSQAARQAAQARATESQKLKAASIQTSLSGHRKSKSKPRTKSDASPNLGKPTIPFDSLDTILLLGEANFSFALSLVLPPHSHPAHQLCATSYDSEDVCYSKYGDARTNVDKLREKGVKVGFGVDAGHLEGSKLVGKGRRWSRVIFNFPHAGAGITDQNRNILTNQTLLLRTLRSAAPLLTEGPSAFPVVQPRSKGKGKHVPAKRRSSPKYDSDPDAGLNLDPDDPDMDLISLPITNASFLPPSRQGTLLITHLAQPPYTLWDLPHLATRPPPVCPGTNLPQPKYRLLRSFRFHPQVYAGYEHRRTIGFNEGLSKGGNEEIVGRLGRARTWEFALAEG